MDNDSNSVKKIFSLKLRNILSKILQKSELLQEIRLRTNKPLIVKFDNKEVFIKENGEQTTLINEAFIVPMNEIRETMEYISNYSLYAYEEEVKQGYITVSGGHRIGICGKAILSNGYIKTIKYISFINIRIAHEIKGCSDMLLDKIYKNESEIYNTLIISPPGAGKTTLLRDLIRNISNGNSYIKNGLNVGIADERSEIAACYLGVPQNDVGIRTDVLDGVMKASGIMMLIRTMSPKVVAVDEIGSIDDINAIKQGVNCGCSFICTVHGDGLEDIKKKPVLKELINDGIFKKYILINKNNAKNRYIIRE